MSKALLRRKPTAPASTIVGKTMHEDPARPHSENRVPSCNATIPWADLIVFLSILVLGVILSAVVRATAASLATICAALGGLFAVWKYPRSALSLLAQARQLGREGNLPADDPADQPPRSAGTPPDRSSSPDTGNESAGSG
jgi:hypothetical protein